MQFLLINCLTLWILICVLIHSSFQLKFLCVCKLNYNFAIFSWCHRLFCRFRWLQHLQLVYLGRQMYIAKILIQILLSLIVILYLYIVYNRNILDWLNFFFFLLYIGKWRIFIFTEIISFQLWAILNLLLIFSHFIRKRGIIRLIIRLICKSGNIYLMLSLQYLIF